VPRALEDWACLDGLVKARVKSALKNGRLTPRAPCTGLRSPLVGYYKVKQRGIRYQLMYLVRDGDNHWDILVLAVLRCDEDIYKAAAVARLVPMKSGWS
jgi:mRNA interferase RelE/StbE